MILAFAIVGGVLAFIPGVSFLLIVMEFVMLYMIGKDSPKFNMFAFLGLAGAMVAVSAILKGVASFLHILPLVGQFANGIVAFLFILAVGKLAERHYA